MVTIVDRFRLGGPAGKHRVRIVATAVDATNGLEVGANDDDIPATAFGLTKITACQSVLAYTTSSGAGVRIYPATPNFDEDSILATKASTATDTEAARQAVGDIITASTESLKFVLEGY